MSFSDPVRDGLRRGWAVYDTTSRTLPDEAQTKCGAPAQVQSKHPYALHDTTRHTQCRPKPTTTHQVTVEFDFVAGPAIDIKLQWFEKPATRYL